MDVAEVEQCSICLSEMDDPAKVYTLPDCRHAFHADCIVLYLRSGTGNNSRCPLCRGNPRVTLKKQDVMQRAKIMLERHARGDATLDAETVECAHRIQLMDQRVRRARENLTVHVRNHEVAKKRKEELLAQYRVLRDEFRRKSRPIMKQVDQIQTDNNRRRKRLQRVLWEAKKAHRDEMRCLGLMGL